VSLSFIQNVKGRTIGHACVARTPKNAGRDVCSRTVVAGALSFAGHVGTNKVVFQGHVSRSNKLKAGRYTVVITATDAAGISVPKSLSFTIVK
jgi:hypothetical protein